MRLEQLSSRLTASVSPTPGKYTCPYFSGVHLGSAKTALAAALPWLSKLLIPRVPFVTELLILMQEHAANRAFFRDKLSCRPCTAKVSGGVTCVWNCRGKEGDVRAYVRYVLLRKHASAHVYAFLAQQTFPGGTTPHFTTRLLLWNVEL